MQKKLTNAVAVVIFEPPDAPATSLTLPDLLSTSMAGLIEEIGLFPVGRFQPRFEKVFVNAERRKYLKKVATTRNEIDVASLLNLFIKSLFPAILKWLG